MYPKHNLKVPQVAKAVRVLLTGNLHSPDMGVVCGALGKEKVHYQAPFLATAAFERARLGTRLDEKVEYRSSVSHRGAARTSAAQAGRTGENVDICRIVCGRHVAGGLRHGR